MAEASVYAGLERDLVGGVLSMDPPAGRAQEPVVTPAYRETPQERVTSTADVQRAAEAAVGEVQGGGVVVGFGPVLEDLADLPAHWRIASTDDGPKRGFMIAESVGMMPMLRFAHAAKTGMDTDDLEGMAALYTMIRDTVAPEEWDAFQDYATEIKAEDEELLAFVSGAIEVISARKARQRGSSSATSQRTSGRSKGSSSRQGSVIPPGARVPEGADGLMPVADMVRR